MTQEPRIELRHGSDGVVRLTLARAAKRNALDRRMVAELLSGLREAREDPDARIILLAGQGPDFCAGADVAEMAETRDAGPEAAREDALQLADLLVTLRRYPLPVVASVRGRALGGGMGLVLASDLVLAEEGAAFALPEIRLGFVPAIVMALLLRKLPENRAFELALSGRMLLAQEAREWGLVNRIMPPDGFDEAVGTYCAELASLPHEAVERTKWHVREIEEMSLEEGVQRGAELNARSRFSDDAGAGFRTFLERPGSRRGPPTRGTDGGPQG